MEDQNQSHGTQGSSQGQERTVPVRSRWTPKPEQILILESIFNSGMVNPPKEETTRIRRLLEKYGTVGDANVFYWFQNRRSRSRRRQRQMQAGQVAIDRPNPTVSPTLGVIQSNYTSSSSFTSPPLSYSTGPVFNNRCDDLFSITQQIGPSGFDPTVAMDSSMLWPLENSNSEYQSGLITVFINGVATDVPKGTFNIKAIFGYDVMLVHSSGDPVAVDECGISLQSLQMGENYFLVSRAT